jgi:hypothetical protein
MDQSWCDGDLNESGPSVCKPSYGAMITQNTYHEN